MEECLICESSGDDLVQVTERGKSSPHEFAKLRQNDEVAEKLDQQMDMFVHGRCRKYFNNHKRILADLIKNTDGEKVSMMQTKNIMCKTLF